MGKTLGVMKAWQIIIATSFRFISSSFTNQKVVVPWKTIKRFPGETPAGSPPVIADRSSDAAVRRLRPSKVARRGPRSRHSEFPYIWARSRSPARNFYQSDSPPVQGAGDCRKDKRVQVQKG